MADMQANIGATKPEIPDEPDWAAMRVTVELRIRNLSNEKLQTQGTSTANGISNSAGTRQGRDLASTRSSTLNVTAASTQNAAANVTFVAQLTEDDTYVRLFPCSFGDLPDFSSCRVSMTFWIPTTWRKNLGIHDQLYDLEVKVYVHKVTIYFRF